MKQRRLKNGSKVLFDYRQLMIVKPDGVKLVEMRRGPMSYETKSGVTFYKDHPYQWVPEEEADYLISFRNRNLEFGPATMDDVEDYYAID